MSEASKQYGPYHRTGVPGGPGCKLGSLEITRKDRDGNLEPALLLNAGESATEIEMLRTILAAFTVQWGKDDLGWWAVVPRNEYQ